MLVIVAVGYQLAVFLSDCVRQRGVVLLAAAARYLPRAARRNGEKKVRIPREGPPDPRDLSRGRPDLLRRSLVREWLGALPPDPSINRVGVPCTSPEAIPLSTSRITRSLVAALIRATSNCSRRVRSLETLVASTDTRSRHTRGSDALSPSHGRGRSPDPRAAPGSHSAVSTMRGGGSWRAMAFLPGEAGGLRRLVRRQTASTW
jgi:hypothetical protein